MKKLFAAILLSFFATNVHAFDHMLSGGSSSSVEFESVNDSYESNLSVFVGYYYSLNEFLQFGGDISASLSDNRNVFSILPGVILNVSSGSQSSLASSYFFKLNAGSLVVDGTSTTNSEFMMKAEAGKRFELASNVAWSPSVELVHFPSVEGADPTFYINVFKLEIFF